MNEKEQRRAELINQGITLNSLKDRQQSLNARLLLAMQRHDADEQERIKQEIDAVQEDIDCLTLNAQFSK